ncbi:MAG: DUF4115 domain-containing protein [Bacteroidota bacterium]|nr:DUF4115 domain-containing protein [Bacteroidota bacterium]
MKTIGDKLRNARETQGRSLDDIALATRIDRKYIDDIEHGLIPALPMIYIRAFIKAYAVQVGLNPNELLDSGELSTIEHTASIKSDSTSTKSEIPANQPVSKIEPRTQKKFRYRQQLILFALIIIILLGFLISMLWLRDTPASSVTEEISFSDVIKEHESKMKPMTSITDSVTDIANIKSTSGKNDSLWLESVSSESVWVRINIDGITLNEYLFPPFYRKKWKAKQYFIVSVGNGAAVSFSLNGNRLGPLSTIRKPMRNVQLDWATLKKFQKQGSSNQKE